MDQGHKQSRRRHSKELKRTVLAECAEPGASVARVALSHGLNANLVLKWRRLATLEQASALDPPKSVFVPVVVPPAQAPVAHDIRIELRRGAMAINVSWPLGAAAECANAPPGCARS